MRFRDEKEVEACGKRIQYAMVALLKHISTLKSEKERAQYLSLEVTYHMKMVAFFANIGITGRPDLDAEQVKKKILSMLADCIDEERKIRS
jgi:hypothetical protein